MNEKEICELMDKIPTFEGSKSIYNPMETFVEYVSQKRYATHQYWQIC